MNPKIRTRMEGAPTIQRVFQSAYREFCGSGAFVSDVQAKAAQAILRCKTPLSGWNASVCEDCGHLELHTNSCRNRNCPNCQAVQKERWVNQRRAEVIDSPYYHVVFTLPHERNPLIFCNQTLLYSLFHRCCADTLLELSSHPKYLGATPGLIQVLHTWNQELLYHVHMHCILSGGGLTAEHTLRKSRKGFFLPVHVLRDKFKGKYLALLDSLYQKGSLVFSSSCRALRNSYEWKEFRSRLYGQDWCPYIKETFRGFGNAIEYLGRYTHKIAISNRRILSVSETETVFSARGKKPGEPRRTITVSSQEFLRRFLLHVLPKGFQKIRYYGFLNNRTKTRNLKLIFTIQGYQKFKTRYQGLTMAELLKAVWKVDITRCPACGGHHMKPSGRIYAIR